MRDYAQFRPRFWTSGTGKSFRGDPNAQMVAVYLFTSPHSNLIGLYYLPISYIVNDTGLTFEGASKGLARVCEAGFAHYDHESEYVWVVNAAREQVGEQVDKADKRIKGVLNELAKHRKCPFYAQFCEHYAELFGTVAPQKPEAPPKPPASPLQAPAISGTGSGTGDRTGTGEGNARARGPESDPEVRSEFSSGHVQEFSLLLGADFSARNKTAPEIPFGQLRGAAKRAHAHSVANRMTFDSAARLLIAAGVAWAEATKRPLALLLLEIEPGSKPPASRKLQMARATTAEDFEDCPPIEQQLAERFG